MDYLCSTWGGVAPNGQVPTPQPPASFTPTCPPACPQEARNTKDIAESIEEERAKVVARTPITQEVRQGGRTGARGLWRSVAELSHCRYVVPTDGFGPVVWAAETL